MPSQRRPRRHTRTLAFATVGALALAPAALVASPAQALIYGVSDEAGLLVALSVTNTTAGLDHIQISADITLTAALPAITDDLTIRSIYGSHTIYASGFHAFSGTDVDLTVRDLTIDTPAHGFDMSGGSTTLENVTMTGATGFGVRVLDGDLSITDSTIAGSALDNVSFEQIAAPSTSVVVRDTTVSGSAADGLDIIQGGTGTVTLTDVTLTSNTDSGVLLYLVDDAEAVLTDVTADGNHRGVSASASDRSRLDLAGIRASANTTAGLTTDTRLNAVLTADGITLTSQPHHGWLLRNYSDLATVTVSRLTATDNRFAFLPYVRFGATISLADAHLEGGQVGVWAIPDGPANPADGGTVTLTRTRILGQSGGGLVIGDDMSGLDLSLVDSTIAGVTSTPGGGGIRAVLVDSTLTIERSTVSGNSAVGGGGGAWIDGDAASSFRVLSSTFSGNTAPSGSAMRIVAGDVRIAHSTIHSPLQTGGHLVTLQADTATITHSILEGGTAALSSVGPMSLSIDHSLVEEGLGLTDGAVAAGARNITRTSANLDALADNGGPTLTMMPRIGSPVIDAGSPSVAAPPATDQRGLARVLGGRIDLGAVEAVATLPATGRDAAAAWAVGVGMLALGALGLVVAMRAARRRSPAPL